MDTWTKFINTHGTDLQYCDWNFFQTIITIILSCSIIQFRRSSQIPIALPITFIWNFRLNFSIDVVQRATTFRMLQSQTYVVRKSNNLQNVAVANLRGSKEQQPPECCSRKPTCVAVGNLRSSKERHIKLYRSHNSHGSYP